MDHLTKVDQDPGLAADQILTMAHPAVAAAAVVAAEETEVPLIMEDLHLVVHVTDHPLMTEAHQALMTVDLNLTTAETLAEDALREAVEAGVVVAVASVTDLHKVKFGKLPPQG
jgi:hypothetical protein